MPPFKNAEEKKKYILEHKDLFDALEIPLDEKKIDDMAKSTDNYAEYEAGNRYLEYREKTFKAGQDYFKKAPAIEKAMLNRLPGFFYEPSGTPEAQKNNDKLQEILLDNENGPRRFADLCMKKILDFDDSIFAQGSDAVERYVAENPMDSYFYFAVVDAVNKLSRLYDMNNPKDAAVVNAVQDKALFIQGMVSYSGKLMFQSSKLATILPEEIWKDPVKAETILGLTTVHLRKKNARYEAENSKKEHSASANKQALEIAQAERDIAKNDSLQTTRLMAYVSVGNEEKAKLVGCKELLEKKLIGPEGKYNRAYRLEETVNPETQERVTEKVYITKEELANAYATEEGKQGIHFETVPLEDRIALRDFTDNVYGIGEKTLWPDEATKRKYGTAIRNMLAISGYNMSDAEYENSIKDIVREKQIIAAGTLAAKFEKADPKYTIMPHSGLTDAERTVGGLYIDGDSEEIKQWNENVSLLAQSREGLVQLAHIAAKKMLSIDIEKIINTDNEESTQYLLEHPVEQKLTYIMFNVINCYKTSLPRDEQETDPVVMALENRKRLLEDFQNHAANARYNADRIIGLIPPELTDEQVMAMSVSAALASSQTRDPEMKEIYKEIHSHMSDYNTVEMNVKREPGYRTVAKELFINGTIDEDMIYKRPYIEVELKDVAGKVVKDENGNAVTKKEYINWVKATELIADAKPEEVEKVKASIKYETISQDARAKFDRFMAETPDNPTLNVTTEERENLKHIRDVRTIRSKNDQAINKMKENYATLAETDSELKALLENAEKAKTPEHFEALQKALEYVNEHRDFSKNELDQAKFDVALTTIASIDGDCAINLVKRINVERKLGHFFDQPEIDLDAVLEKSETKPGDVLGRENFNYRNPFDKRIQNIKEIYEHLRDNKDPWYHVNGDKFKAMMQSMKGLMEYASSTSKPDARIVESMLVKVKETSKEYTKHKNAHLGLGQDRRSAALAAVIVLDAEEGRQLLNEVRDKAWVAGFAKKIGMAKEFVERKEVLDALNLSKPLKKEEILAKMSEDLERTKAKMNNDGAVAEDIAAEYTVKERIYNSLKAKDVDGKAIIGYMAMSKKLIKEQSDNVIKDDVYRTVINSMKLNNNNSYDKLIEGIENKYLHAKADAVIEQEKAIVKEAERNEIANKMEQNKPDAELNKANGAIALK